MGVYTDMYAAGNTSGRHYFTETAFADVRTMRNIEEVVVPGRTDPDGPVMRVRNATGGRATVLAEIVVAVRDSNKRCISIESLRAAADALQASLAAIELLPIGMVRR